MLNPTYVVLTTICWWMASPAMAQSLPDTVLQAVEVHGLAVRKYTTGSRVERVDSLSKAMWKQGTLADLLGQATGLYLKEYGNGGTATVSFRGTGASHTAVLWNGLNINSMTLGQTDFSLLPIFLLDQVTVQHGGSAALNGSDAIGGSILLDSRPDWLAGVKIGLHQQVGSFGQLASGLDARVGNGRWTSRTRIYRNSLENNFPFDNRAKFGAPEERQENAAMVQYGGLQEWQAKVGKQGYMALSAWYTRNERDIQPIMANNGQTASYETLQDESLRLMGTYFRSVSGGFVRASAGYLLDDQLYDRAVQTKTGRWVGQVETERELGNRASVRVGGHWQGIAPEVDAYDRDLFEHRFDWFVSGKYSPAPRLNLTANLRQTVVPGFRAPIAPALGMEYAMVEHSDKSLTAKLLTSRSYRIPTFNDRYWNPGGNPDLRPESGWNAEAGLAYRRQRQLDWQGELTAFRMQVTDWILWTDQGSFWSPTNVREVAVSGLEASGKVGGAWGKIRWQTQIQYALTNAKNERGLNEFDRSAGKQLPYTPQHRAVARWQAERDGWLLACTATHTGKRFLTTTNESELEGFTLLNVHFSKTFTWKKNKVSLHAQALNLFNTTYENMAQRAMPGRNFRLGAHFSIE